LDFHEILWKCSLQNKCSLFNNHNGMPFFKILYRKYSPWLVIPSYLLNLCLQWLSDQYNSMYVLTLIYFLFICNMLQPTISAIIRWYYKNIKGKTDSIKKEASPFTILFRPELIIFTTRNTKILLRFWQMRHIYMSIVVT
jgi:hypothetical protein